MLVPITFTRHETLGLPPEEIARRVLEVDRWPDFKGHAFLPGIKKASFELRTPEVVGSRIRVMNTDDSTHTEEIVEWAPNLLRLRMLGFSSPLSRIAARFEEAWVLTWDGTNTRVERRFELHPRSTIARPFLWLISLPLRSAIGQHLRQMKREVGERPAIGG